MARVPDRWPLLTPRLTALLTAWAIALLATLLSGCLEVTATLDAKGGATIEMRVSNLDAEGHQRMRAQLTSPSVELVKSTYEDTVGTYVLKVHDVEKLRTASLFRGVRIEISSPRGGRRTLDLSIPRRPKTDHEVNLPKPDYVVIDLTVSVPGSIAETNGTKVDDTTAKWNIRLADMLGKGSVEVRTVYRADAGIRPGASEVEAVSP